MRIGRAAIWIAKGVVGTAAIAWGVTVLPTFWHQAPIEHLASRIAENEPYKNEVLADWLPAIAGSERAEPCRLPAAHAAAVVRLSLAADLLEAAERERIDGSLQDLRESIRSSLACSPADPFLWLALFWAENTIDGLSAEHSTYLRMSYLRGPNEGWIALKRNRVALALFDQLPSDVQDMATAEFIHMIDTGFMRQAVANLTGPGWNNRGVFVDRLNKMPLIQREALVRAVHNEGYEIELAGVRRGEFRPWR